MKRKLSDLKLMAPFLGIRLRSKNGRPELVFSDPRYVSGEAVLFTVDPGKISDAKGNSFEMDLQFEKWGGQ